MATKPPTSYCCLFIMFESIRGKNHPFTKSILESHPAGFWPIRKIRSEKSAKPFSHSLPKGPRLQSSSTSLLRFCKFIRITPMLIGPSSCRISKSLVLGWEGFRRLGIPKTRGFKWLRYYDRLILDFRVSPVSPISLLRNLHTSEWTSC